MEYEIVPRSKPAAVKPLAADLPPVPPRPPGMFEEAQEEPRAILQRAQEAWDARSTADATELLRRYIPELEPSYLAAVFAALADLIAGNPSDAQAVTEAFADAHSEVDALLGLADGDQLPRASTCQARRAWSYPKSGAGGR